MWLFTTLGFFSVVAKGAPGMLCVRSRWRADLDALRTRYSALMPDMTAIEGHTGTDYAFRFYVPQAEFSAVMAATALDIAAPNFKTAVGEVSHTRASLLGRVWQVIADAAWADHRQPRMLDRRHP